LYGKRGGLDSREYFVETMCGLVANPVARMWNGLGRNPHFVSVGRNLSICCEGFYGKREGLDLREYFVETMCGIVANPVARVWNGLGRNPHFVSVRKNLDIYCEGFYGKGRGLDWRE
jgi:hypothetical protein